MAGRMAPMAGWQEGWLLRLDGRARLRDGGQELDGGRELDTGAGACK